MFITLVHSFREPVKEIEKYNHRYCLYELSRLKKKNEIENKIAKEFNK